jgi:hypothetical protein
LTELETRRAELLGLKSKPAETESRIQVLIKRTADYLLGRGDDDGGAELERRGLDDRLAIERHRAEAVDTILPALDRDIEVAQLRVKRLQEREAGFLKPALVEHAEKFVPDYIRAIEALKKAIAPLAGLNEFFGGDGVNVKLPSFGLDTLEKAGTRITETDAAMWDALAESLGATPRPKGWDDASDE